MKIPTFSTFLREFGDRPFPWKITQDTYPHIQARFDPPLEHGEEPYHYVVTMWIIEWTKVTPGRPAPPPTPTVWEFGFGLVRPKTTTHSTVGASLRNDGYHYEGIVGNIAHAHAVISTVANIFRAFLQRRQPLEVVFTAKDPSRQRLYRRLASRVASVLPGYVGREAPTGTYRVRQVPR